jgi:regulator of protease activity HflC (stomatin/prohibitin superfamily)
VIIVVLYVLSAIKILSEYERGVIFRLGRVLPAPKGPGIILVFAPIDRMVRISLRTETLEVPPQDVVTRDNVTVKVNAVIYFRVIEPIKAVIEVANFLYATSQLAQTTLRSVLGEVELDELLSQREKLNVRLQSVLDQHTGPWGVKVTMVEVKQVDLPDQMIRAIARQAEAERERRAKIIHAEGEFSAAERLAGAAELIQKQPAAIQLRYLQTLVEIGRRRTPRRWSSPFRSTYLAACTN